jgi:hypothetical protein
LMKCKGEVWHSVRPHPNPPPGERVKKNGRLNLPFLGVPL